LSIVFDLERTNQLNLLPDKDLVDLCPPIEPYQVTKNHYDQEDKFTAYRTIPTFQLLISQEKCYIEQFQKEGDCGF
jgi:hypothetical protein